MATVIVCRACGETRSPDGFYRQNGRLVAKCKPCVNAYQRGRYVHVERGPKPCATDLVQCWGAWPSSVRQCQAPECRSCATWALLLKDGAALPVLVTLCDPCKVIALEACGDA